MGARLQAGLLQLGERFPCVQAVRGRGLLLGFDLMDGCTLWPKDRCVALFRACLSRGLLTMAYTPKVRINPPLVLTEAQVDESLAILAAALEAVQSLR